MNSKSINSNTDPISVNFPAPVSIKIKPSDVRFMGEYRNEEIILNTSMPSSDISQIKDRIVSITYSNLSQFFTVVNVEELGSGSTITVKPLEKALIDQLWSNNKIKGEFFYLVETARNIQAAPNKLNFELADNPGVCDELDGVVESLINQIPEQSVTVKTLVDTLDPERQVTDIAAIAETPAFEAKSYVINTNLNIKRLNNGKEVITTRTFMGKTIGLTYDDTTQKCSQDEFQNIVEELTGVNEDGGYVDVSVINNGALIVDNKRVETINKLDFGKNGLYYRFTMTNESTIPKQPQTQPPNTTTPIVCLNCRKCG